MIRRTLLKGIVAAPFALLAKWLPKRAKADQDFSNPDNWLRSAETRTWDAPLDEPDWPGRDHFFRMFDFKSREEFDIHERIIKALARAEELEAKGRVASIKILSEQCLKSMCSQDSDFSKIPTGGRIELYHWAYGPRLDLVIEDF